jgi:predicted metal-dependent HD superfamily phosphohydrolase
MNRVDGELRAELAALYATPPRAYHCLAHVEEVLVHLETIRARLTLPDEVHAACLFHDAIYIAGRNDNEERSAAAFADAAQRHASLKPLNEEVVRRLILLTAEHGKLERGDVSPDEALFLDCDMAILASDDARFDLYECQIREEYGHLPRFLYRRGRRRFLERLLHSERIYLSQHFHDRFDALARCNLRRALAARG